MAKLQAQKDKALTELAAKRQDEEKKQLDYDQKVNQA